MEPVVETERSTGKSKELLQPVRVKTFGCAGIPLSRISTFAQLCRGDIGCTSAPLLTLESRLFSTHAQVEDSGPVVAMRWRGACVTTYTFQ